MMSKTARTSRIALAFAGVTAGFVALFGFSAEAASPRAHSHASDCEIVAARDRALCKRVQAFHAYGSYSGDPHAYWSVPAGIINVHELTHDGLTHAEMRAQLNGYAAEYREWVTAVPVNMDAMVKKCGNTDGRWVVEYHDEDGRPGGLKLTYKHIVCA